MIDLTIEAICRFAADRDLELDSLALAHAIRERLPEAEVISGFALERTVAEPRSWIRLRGEDIDVLHLAQERRVGLATPRGLLQARPQKNNYMRYLNTNQSRSTNLR
jgi:hypothetical protein